MRTKSGRLPYVKVGAASVRSHELAQGEIC